jgi:hypothetical protein
MDASTINAYLLSISERVLFSFTPHHYFPYLILTLLTLFLFLLSYALRNIKIVNVVSLLFTLGFLIVAPFVTHYAIQTYIEKLSLTEIEISQLKFSSKVSITGTIKNESKYPFTSCKLYATAISKKVNFIENIVQHIVPKYGKTVLLESTIDAHSEKKFYMTIDYIKNSEKFNISLDFTCR